MDKLKITGGQRLKGVCQVSGSKNASLPILASTLLTPDRCTVKNVPNLHDIQSTKVLLESLGVKVNWDQENHTIETSASNVTQFLAHYDLVRRMRASVLVLGPLIARFGEAKVSLPGGCAIGSRPVDLHLHGLRGLGSDIEIHDGYIYAKAKKLSGAKIRLEFPSVGATENILMAATLAKGATVIENAAREPEIEDLASFLVSMGAEIEGAGTHEIHIQGKDHLKGCEYSVMSDRIEGGTLLAAGLITGGDVTICGLNPRTISSVLEKFQEAGAEISTKTTSQPFEIRAIARGRLTAIQVETEPYPGFPTDMQAQLMALLCFAEGTSRITESIFENRFMHVQELARLGAKISVKGGVAEVTGQEMLTGAPVMATDLRASACLALAGLAARGDTIVNRIYHLDRGYDGLEKKLRSLGATIERVS